MKAKNAKCFGQSPMMFQVTLLPELPSITSTLFYASAPSITTARASFVTLFYTTNGIRNLFFLITKVPSKTDLLLIPQPTSLVSFTMAPKTTASYAILHCLII